MSGPSIALVASSPSEPAVRLVVARLEHLLSRGWDAHLVFDGNEAAAWSTIPELARPGLRDRVHLSPSHRPRGVDRAAIPASLAGRLARSPRRARAYLRARRQPVHTLVRGHDVEAALIALAPGVVHFDSAGSARDRLGVKDVLDCGVVVSVGVGDVQSAPLAARREIYLRADVLHVHDEDLWEQLVADGCPRDRPRADVPTPPAGVPLADAPADPPASDPRAARPLHILSVAPLSWRAGHEWALQAMRHLLDSGVDAVVRLVGHGEQLEALHFARHQLDVEDRVEIVEDEADEGALERQLAWADVYLDSAVAAGSRGAVLEAQAAGLPVVVTDRSAIAGAEVDEATGFVTPRRDPAAMAEPLALLARDADLRRRMGETARDRIAARYRMEDHLEGFERVYREMLSG